MKGLFLEILGMSIMAGYVTLLVIVIRLPLKRIPKIYSYALWAVVLFRLLCPIAIESTLSFMPAPPDVVSWNIFSDQSSQENADSQGNEASDAAFPTGTREDTATKRIWFTIAVYIWLAGITLLLFHAMYGYVKLKGRLRTAIWIRDNIYETDRIMTPFVLGFIRPKIYIPLGVNDKDYILQHEQTHIRRRDYLIKPAAYLALCLHWFNPVIWLGYFLMCKDMEMSCDESVLKGSSRDIRRDYSWSLLALSVRQSGLLTPSAFGDGNAKTRVKNVLNYRKPAVWLSMAAAIGILGVMVGCVLNPIKEELIQTKLAVYAADPIDVEPPAEDSQQDASPAVSLAGAAALDSLLEEGGALAETIPNGSGETRIGIINNSGNSISFNTPEATTSVMDLKIANSSGAVVAKIIINGAEYDVPAEGLMFATERRGGINMMPDGVFQYVAPVCDHSGRDYVTESFQYRLIDTDGRLSDPVTVYINILDIAPTAVDDIFTLSQDNAAFRFQANVMNNDVRSPDWISRSNPGSVQNIVWQVRPVDSSAAITVPEGSYNPGGQATAATAQGGRVWINRDGSFEYVPPPRFEGDDSFQYRLNDGDGSPSNWATVTLHVPGP
ncbi:MAG: cadherin-like domain-containing protein [Gracilibacteraceae bacterium]|jgi:beta-lactamase regulating signal transducer with metallopeptidase domain|nr:cadherin-like domain-containing protein [Gracilibacteraceae bacterium]